MTCEEGGGSTGALERATSVARGKPHARNEIFSARLGTLEQGVAPHSRRKGGEGRLARLPHASLNLCNSFSEPCLQSVVKECVLRHQGPRQSVMRGRELAATALPRGGRAETCRWQPPAQVGPSAVALNLAFGTATPGSQQPLGLSLLAASLLGRTIVRDLSK